MSIRSRSRLTLEPLEDRNLLSTCSVDQLTDVGTGNGLNGDLRYCINYANSNPDPDTIEFEVSGTITFQPSLGSPVILSDIDIQGPGEDALILNGDGKMRIFIVGGGTKVQISGLTIYRGLAYDDGGGIYNNGNLTLTNCTLQANVAITSNGGAIHNNGKLTLADSTIVANSAKYGGGIYSNYAMLTIIDSVLSDNYAEFQGGAIDNVYGIALVENSVLSTNRITSTSGNGGAIITYGGVFTVNGSVISENSAPTGSGIYHLSGGLLTVTDTTFSHNLSGGAAAILNLGNATVDGCSFFGNRAGVFPIGGSSGAISHHIGTFTVTNSTFTGNMARQDSGGAITVNSGTMVLIHSTVTGNRSTYPGGGIWVISGSTLQIRNTIVAKNGAPSAPNIDGVISSQGHNLFGIITGSSGHHPTDLLNTEPYLGPLQDNGGPTFTVALLPGSPAINAGDNGDAPEWDQRGPGFPRIVNGTIDIGAFEVQATGIPGITNDLAVLIPADFDDFPFEARRLR